MNYSPRVSRLLMLLIASGTTALIAIAQDANDGGNNSGNGAPVRTSSMPVGAATRLEAFLRQTGAVIIEGFTDVGTVGSDDEGSVRVLAIELTNQATQMKVLGIGIEVHHNAAGANDSNRTALSYVDEAEINALVDGLNTIQHLDPNVTALGGYNARYRTHGDLDIESSGADGVRNVTIRASQILHPSEEITWAAADLPLARVGDLRAQILAAKQLLDKAKK